MKIRIGVGIGATSAQALGAVADGIVEHRFDSLWCSEVLTAPGFDPLVALAWAAARQPRLKLGTTMLLPGRNVMRLAGQLASVDALSGGRLLVTFVPGIDRPPEGSAIGVPVAERRAVIAEAMPLLRRLLAGETVSHRGPVADLDQVTLSPLPVQQPLEFWLGGMAPRSLELCGRLGDGWLPSLCTPEAAREGRAVIERSASEAGRAIDPEHFGVSIGYSRTALDAAATERIAARARGADLSRLVPIGLPALRSAIEEFVSVGFSKFVVRPMDLAPDAWPEELADLADAVLDLQS